MKAHIIENTRVTNTIEVESLSFMPHLIDASLGGKIGDLWDGSIFKNPTLTEKDVVKIAANVREKRNALLAKTDWVVTRAKELGQDVPLAIYNYRGDLRQIPDQAGFPHTIIWPTEV